MTWYKTGTVSVINGSVTVTGAGTAWIANARIGDGLQGPDSRVYEITGVASDTSIEISPPYAGASVFGGAYTIVPVPGYTKRLHDRVALLINEFGDIKEETSEEVGNLTQGAIDASVQASVQATANYVDEAKLARDAAFVNADVFPTLEAGMVATPDGGQFQLVSGSTVIRIKNNAGTPEEVARYPASSVIDDFQQTAQALGEDLTELRSAASGLQTNMVEVQAAAQQLTQGYSELRSATESMQATSQGLVDGYTGLASTVSSLQETTEELVQGYTSLSGAGAGMQQNIATLSVAGAEMQVAIGNLQTMVQTIQQEMGSDTPAFGQREYTSVETTGTHAREDIQLNIVPAGDSTATEVAARITTQAVVEHNNQPGSSIGALQIVTNATGGGFIDKMVGMLSHVNVLGAGRRQSILGYEFGMPYIGAEADIGSVCGFYFPNMAGVPNIDRIGTLSAFANQHRSAIIQNMGVYVDSTLRQVVAAAHIGMAPGRYYTAPYRWRGYSGATAGVADLTPIFIPARSRIVALGVGVEAGVAGAKVKLALYTAERGAVAVLAAQTADLDASSSGVKEGAVDVEVDGGMYWIACLPSVGLSLSSHAPQETGGRASMFGQSDPMASDGSTERSAAVNLGGYVAWPTNANVIPTYRTQDAERHAWLRVG